MKCCDKEHKLWIREFGTYIRSSFNAILTGKKLMKELRNFWSYFVLIFKNITKIEMERLFTQKHS